MSVPIFENSQTQDIYEAQRSCPDYVDIIKYLENGTLPANDNEKLTKYVFRKINLCLMTGEYCTTSILPGHEVERKHKGEYGDLPYHQNGGTMCFKPFMTP